MNVTLERWLNLFALDLLFVLLIVLVLFMVFTPFLPVDVHVDVPFSTMAIKAPGYEDDLTISIPRRDFISVGGEEVSLPEVDRLLASRPYDETQLVRIRAAGKVPFGVVRRVVESARQAGHRRVTIVVQRRPPPPLPESGFSLVGSCPPQYGWLAGSLLAAAVAVAGAVAISLRRKGPRRPGCAGWMLLAIAALALLMALDAARPRCGWWY